MLPGGFGSLGVQEDVTMVTVPLGVTISAGCWTIIRAGLLGTHLLRGAAGTVRGGVISGSVYRCSFGPARHRVSVGVDHS